MSATERALRDHLEALIDIWDDGKQEYDDRMYVGGSMQLQIDEARAFLAEPSAPSLVPTRVTKGDVSMLAATVEEIKAISQELEDALNKYGIGVPKDTQGDEAQVSNEGKDFAQSSEPTPAPVEMPNPSCFDLADPLFEAIWQATKTWDVNSPKHYMGYCGLNGSHVKIILDAVRGALVAWVVKRWQDEVHYRPLVNIHRRSLDDTWRQMLRRLQADDLALIGPTHDMLLSIPPDKGAAISSHGTDQS